MGEVCTRVPPSVLVNVKLPKREVLKRLKRLGWSKDGLLLAGRVYFHFTTTLTGFHLNPVKYVILECADGVIRIVWFASDYGDVDLGLAYVWDGFDRHGDPYDPEDWLVWAPDD